MAPYPTSAEIALLRDGVVHIEGIDGRWGTRKIVEEAGELTQVTLFFVGPSPEDDQRKKQRKAAAKDDARQALAALFDLEDALPPGKRAVVEVIDAPALDERSPWATLGQGKPKPRFHVTVVDDDA